MSTTFGLKLKSITKSAILAITVSGLSIIPVQSTSAHGLISSDNIAASNGTVDASLFVATKLASTAVAHTTAATTSGHADARSTNLFYKDSTSSTAQTATVLTGGLLSLYAMVSTTTAISATGGGIMYAAAAAANIVTLGSTSTGTAFTILEANKGTATAIAIIFRAPSTAGEVTISMRSGGTTPATTPSSTRLLRGSEVASITVTVLGSTTLGTTHFAVGSANNMAVVSGTVNESLITATTTNTGGAAVAPNAANAIEGTSISSSARSTGLLSKDSTMGTAQTATVLAGGKLALYAEVSTTTALTASGGTFSSTTQGSQSITYSDPAKTTLATLSLAQSELGATAVGTLWTAPTTVGTYTVSMYYASNTSVPTLASPGNGVLGGNITVTVVAASSGGSFSAAYSSCVTKDGVTAISQTAANADSTTAQMPNGSPWYIGFILRDAYAAYLADGNIVVTTTTGANVNVDEDGDGSALSSGTGTTVVQYGNGNAGQVKITQATAGAPVTATVTISYNGTTVCTKTVKITGAAASVEISDVATVDLGGNDAPAGWLDEGSLVTGGQRSGHYRVLLKDSAGNIVNPTLAADTFSMDPATTTTTVTALAVNSNYATSTSSSSGARFSVGTFTCGPVAGSSAVKLRHTTAATGVTISSPAFTARCADDPYTYTASWDKASYTAGEIATLTVKFLDSKGNAANSVDTPGPVTMVTPFMTAVSSTGSASMLPTAAGTKAYTFTVGTTSGLTAGSYVSIIDFTNLTAVAAEKQTPSYKLSTGGDSTTNADVLKSIVALIASINKQIQALQKLILRR